MSDQTPPLHNSIIALVSLASNIAANHPKQGLCQLDRLRDMGIAESQIATVIEIARHIRDEAAQMFDASFDEAARPVESSDAQQQDASSCCGDRADESETGGGGCCGSTQDEGHAPLAAIAVEPEGASCCSSTPGGQSCC